MGVLVQPRPARAILMHQDVCHRVSTPSISAIKCRNHLSFFLEVPHRSIFEGLGVYRGVARPGACFAIERTIDEVARAVGRDPLHVRIANMVSADQMPFESAGGMLFDNGDYPESVRRVADLVNYEGVRAKQKRYPSTNGKNAVGCSIET